MFRINKKNEMKNLKVVLMFMCLVTMVSVSQNLKNGVFYTNLLSGVGEKVPMEFTIDSVDIINIQETELYKNWETKTFYNPENAEYLEKWKSLTHIELFLMSTTTMASIKSQFNLKNSTSYIPINGMSSITFKDGKITVTFPMKGQNGYGNYIVSKAFYIIEWVDGKEKVLNFISSS
jgi:hypothetical protein